MNDEEGPKSSYKPPQKMSQRRSVVLTLGVMTLLAVVSFAIVIRLFPPEDEALNVVLENNEASANELVTEGDINGDGFIDVYDLGRMGACYSDQLNYETTCDFDGNGVVDVYDLGKFVDLMRLQEPN